MRYYSNKNKISYLAKKFANNFLKSGAKFSGKQAIDDWIDGRVAVSQPKYYVQLQFSWVSWYGGSYEQTLSVWDKKCYIERERYFVHLMQLCDNYQKKTEKSRSGTQLGQAALDNNHYTKLPILFLITELCRC